jgi:hypothetical protein
VKPSDAVPALMPFAKLPNSVIAIDPGLGRRPSAAGILTNLPGVSTASDRGLLIFRDYSSNVRRMVQVLEKLEAQ